MPNSDAVRARRALRGDALLEALSKDRRDQASMDDLWLAAQSWLGNGGTASMNRFLPLPTTSGKLKQTARDLWHRKAACLLDADLPSARAAALHRELTVFFSRGAWRSWAELQRPPEDASELRKCLFFAVKFNDKEVLSERQIYRILSEMTPA